MIFRINFANKQKRRFHTKEGGIMKKIFKIFIVVIVLLSAVSIAGSAARKDRNVTIEYGEERLLSASYSPDLKTLTKIFFLHRNDRRKYCEKEFSGNYGEALRSLNEDLYNDVNILADGLDEESVEPRAEIKDGVFTYFEGKDGRLTDREKLYEEVFVGFGKGEIFTLKTQTIPPRNTMEELKKNTVKRAEFFTVFAGSGANRIHNISLAASALNDVSVEPGEKLSFNLTVGERTAERGYLPAKVISDGVFTEGVGGGVCQVSTTLFDAWLYAGLGFEQAAAHSLPVSYVEPSLDAMVSSATDLVLINDSDFAVYLYCRTTESRIYVTVYGAPLTEEIRLRSEKIKTIQAEYDTEYVEGTDWAEGERERIIVEAKDGLISESYREFYVNGVPVKEEKLRKNVYKSRNGKKLIRKTSAEENDTLP